MGEFSARCGVVAKMDKEDPRYNVPDMIDIEVSDPVTEEDAEGKPQFTTFKITTHTNLPEYKSNSFSVRRRYSDFEYLRAHLVTQVSNNEKTKGSLRRVPGLPGKKLFGKYERDFIEARRIGLEEFLNRCAGHAICRLERGYH